MKSTPRLTTAAGALLVAATLALPAIWLPAGAAPPPVSGQAGCELGPYARSAAEMDYGARGARLFFQMTAAGNVKARETYLRGLKDFPDSIWLKTGLAWTYLEDVYSIRSTDPASDVNRAYALVKEAAVANEALGDAAWSNHWAMVGLAMLHDRDPARTVAEAEIVHRLLPDDARAHSQIAYWVGVAGKLDKATEWAEWAVRQEPKGPNWIAGNLGALYYLVGRYTEALDKLKGASELFPDFLANTYVALGRIDDARATIATWRKDDPSATVAKMRVFSPMVPTIEERYVADLRKAGLPES